MAQAASAEALFQEGKRLLELGRTDAACVLLAESDAADPAVSTLGLLAACHEQQGRLATAWKEYRETVRRAAAAGDPRGDFAQQRAAALEPRLSRLVLRLAPRAAAVELLRDGDPMPAAEVGVEVPVDGGTHEIVARAPGRREHRVAVVAKEGATVTVEVPELALLAPPPVVAPPALPPEAPPSGPSARRVAGLILTGAGVAGLGMGIGFGVSAIDSNVASRGFVSCTTPDACGQGRALRSSAYTAAAASTAGFVVGAAGVGVGLALVLWPSPKGPSGAATGLHVTPLAGPRGGGAAVGGAF